MTKVLIVLGHGRTSSLCHHLLEVVRRELGGAGVPCRLHDLLADGFDPVLRLEAGQRHATACTPEHDALVHRYQQDVRWADTYIIIHPVWWFAPPAILKGWVDRVLVEDVAIEYPARGAPEGLLGGRRALIVQTFNTSRILDRTVFGGLSELFWRRAVFMPAGVRTVKRLAVYGVDGIAPAKLARQCDRLARTVSTLMKST